MRRKKKGRRKTMESWDNSSRNCIVIILLCVRLNVERENRFGNLFLIIKKYRKNSPRGFGMDSSNRKNFR